MRAGKLRDLLRLERPRVVKETTGGYEPDPDGPDATGWEFVGELWADVEDISARERYSVGQLDSGVSTTVTIRYDERVDATCRFRFKQRDFERVLEIVGPPIRDRRRRSMTLTCAEKAI